MNCRCSTDGVSHRRTVIEPAAEPPVATCAAAATRALARSDWRGITGSTEVMIGAAMGMSGGGAVRRRPPRSCCGTRPRGGGPGLNAGGAPGFGEAEPGLGGGALVDVRGLSNILASARMRMMISSSMPTLHLKTPQNNLNLSVPSRNQRGCACSTYAFPSPGLAMASRMPVSAWIFFSL